MSSNQEGLNQTSAELMDAIFRIIQIETNKPWATTASGKSLPKTKLTLQNSRFATLVAVDWRTAHSFKEGDVVSVSGVLKDYRGEKQLGIKRIAPAQNYNSNDLLPVYPGSVDALEKRLAAYIAVIPDLRLRKLAEKILDPESETGRNFRLAPASPGSISHEPYLHGLMEHLIEVAETAYDLAEKARSFRPEYSQINLSHVMFGALIHDLAKTTAYKFDKGGIVFSAQGRLNAHLIESYALIRQELYGSGELTGDEIDRILHIVASHHGADSDVPPKTIEAVIVATADRFCSQLGSVFGYPHNKT